MRMLVEHEMVVILCYVYGKIMQKVMSSIIESERVKQVKQTHFCTFTEIFVHVHIIRAF